MIHQRGNDGAEGGSDDNCNGEVKDISPQNKCLEILHETHK
jgi:hypothetical protein